MKKHIKNLKISNIMNVNNFPSGAIFQSRTFTAP